MEMDWSSLPKELLDIIIKHLPIKDQVCFGAVNKLWASVAAERRHPPSPKLPWIWMTPPERTRRPGAGDFYCPSDKRVYNLTMPQEALVGYCCGTHEGWLIMTDNPVNNLFFLNPLIPNARYTVQLPDPIVAYLPYYNPLVILSSIPTDPQCIVLVLHLVEGLWIGRPFMGEEWSRLPIVRCSDLILHDRSIYAATNAGELFLVEVGSGSDGHSVKSVLPPPLDGRLFRPFHSCWRLVESCKRELLMVFFIDDGDMDAPMAVRQVFKASLGKGKWEKIRTLGDQMLLVCPSCTISMKASDLPDFQENCVYSVSDHCIHMLDMKKKKIEKDVDKSLDLFLSPRVFFTPSLM